MASKMGKKFSGLLGRSKTVALPSSSHTFPEVDVDSAPEDSPEGRVGRAVRLFCESGGSSNGGDEVLHLPVIVDGAESSPVAAAAAAQQIRIFLSREWAVKPYVQYNAIMLVRILSDNPGPSFTRNFDKVFVSTVKEALRMCKDPSTQQILRETLDSLEAHRSTQDGVGPLIQMWRKEKGHQNSLPLPSQNNRGFPPQPQPGAYRYGYEPQYMPQQRPEPHRHHSRQRQLPPAVELASRVEEAKNSAKILLQLIQSTPSEELLNNDLVREFADRCQSAQRSMQTYIACDNPPPDDETMLTLIETNEQLSLASSRYQRSLLNARKAMGGTPSPNPETMQKDNYFGGNVRSPPPTQQQQQNLFTPPRSPPPRAVGQSAFGAPSTYQAPSYQPPQPSNGMNAFSNSESSFALPPNPPPAMLARLNSREGQPTASQPLASSQSDPFADPVEHSQNPAPLAYNTTYPTTSSSPINRTPKQTFSVDTGPTYASGHMHTASRDSDNPYESSPVRTRAPTSSALTEADSSSRPYNIGAPTVSYIGRQNSAADHFTMHGAQPESTVSEIDGHSEVGRTQQHQPPSSSAFGFVRTDTGRTDGSGSAYSVTPVATRTG